MGKNGAILVMGASGQLGRALKRGWAGGPLWDRAVWQYRDGVAAPNHVLWSPLQADAPRLAGLDAVIVLSGATLSNGADMALNRDLALAGLRAAQVSGARHVFLASSQAVYAPGCGPLSEDAPTSDATGYGAAKLRMERAAADWLDEQGPTAPGITCLRIGNVVGTDMLGKAARAGGDLTLDRFADGQGPVRSYIGPGGFARVIASLVKAVDRGERLPFLLNLAAPAPVRMQDLLTAWGRDWTWRPAPAGARQSVLLNVGTLARWHAFEPRDCDPAEMVREWAEVSRS